jgi:hypothetical protein
LAFTLSPRHLLFSRPRCVYKSFKLSYSRSLAGPALVAALNSSLLIEVRYSAIFGDIYVFIVI